jgi:hypothetical protein
VTRTLHRQPGNEPSIGWGSRGSSVADGLSRIKRLLNRNLGNLPEPTRYNTAAEIQIKFFQLSRGLDPDGVIGSSTWKRIKEEEKPAPSQRPSSTPGSYRRRDKWDIIPVIPHLGPGGFFRSPRGPSPL